MKNKTAEDLLQEIKQRLQDTEGGSDADVLDEAINDVLDMIMEFEKLKTFKYVLMTDDAVIKIGEVKANTEFEAELLIERDILPKTIADGYALELVK